MEGKQHQHWRKHQDNVTIEVGNWSDHISSVLRVLSLAFSHSDWVTTLDLMKCKLLRPSYNKEIVLKCRIDTLKELDYYKSGGILQYVLDSIVNIAS